MGSLTHLGHTTEKLEAAVTRTISMADVKDAMQNFWTENTHWYNEGQDDELCRETAVTLAAFNINRGRVYENHADFYKDAAPLLLTLRSLRELLIRWAGIDENSERCNAKGDHLNPIFSHSMPNLTDFLNPGVGFRALELSNNNEPELQSRGIRWPQMPLLNNISARVRLKKDVGLRLSRIVSDSSRIIGVMNVERLPPPVKKDRRTKYTLDGRTSELSVQWKEELVPQVLTNAEDDRHVPLFTRRMLVLSQIYNILEMARMRRSPLVAYDAPVGRDIIWND